MNNNVKKATKIGHMANMLMVRDVANLSRKQINACTKLCGNNCHTQQTTAFENKEATTRIVHQNPPLQ